jgi:hypothetical protein
MTGRLAEGPAEVVAGDAADACDIFKRDVARKVAFDKPERFSDRVHASLTQHRRLCRPFMRLI